MDTVTILREFWRLKRFVIVVAVLGVIAGAAVMQTASQAGLATAQILVDTPSSQVVNVAPKGYDTVGVRANLLASLMVDGVVKDAIAARAGLQPNQIVGVDNATATPELSTPAGSQAYVLTTQVPSDGVGDELPIVELQAQAPTSAQAAKLANAAIAGLDDYLATKAAQQQVPDADRLQVTSTGVAQSATVAQGGTPLIAAVVAVLVFVLGCVFILGVRAAIRGWRAAAARELSGEDQLPIVNERPDEYLIRQDLSDEQLVGTKLAPLRHARPLDSRRRFTVGPSNRVVARSLDGAGPGIDERG